MRKGFNVNHIKLLVVFVGYYKYEESHNNDNDLSKNYNAQKIHDYNMN